MSRYISRQFMGEPTGKEYDFQSAESRPFTLTSEIDATLPRFQIKEGDMWESLNGRNQPLIQVAPTIVHETKLQHEGKCENLSEC